MSQQFSILSLNIQHGGGKRVRGLFDEITRVDADAVVLSEHRLNANGELIREILSGQGYAHHAYSSIHHRDNGLAVFSKRPFVSTAFANELPDHPARLLRASFESHELLAVCFPQAKHKKPVFEFIADNVPDLLGERGLVVGDLNTGNNGLDSEGVPFPGAKEFDSLVSGKLIDTWRSRHPDQREYTWYSNHGNGFRIDHALATPAFDQGITGVRYLHRFREDGFTDHSGLLVGFH